MWRKFSIYMGLAQVSKYIIGACDRPSLQHGLALLADWGYSLQPTGTLVTLPLSPVSVDCTSKAVTSVTV